MDIKSKKINNCIIIKCIAVLVLTICFGLSAAIFANLVRNVNGLEVLSKTDYLKTNELFYYQQNFYTGLDNLLRYKNEDYIKQGKALDKTEFENRKEEAFNEWYNNINQQINNFNGNIGVDLNEENRLGIYSILKKKFETENAPKIEEIYNSIIQYQLSSYYSLLDKVNNKEGLYYYATNGEDVYTNCEQSQPEFFTKFKAYYLFDKSGIKSSHNIQNSMSYFADSLNNKIYIAVNDEYIAKKQGELDNQRIYLKNGLTMLLSLVILMIAAISYLIWKAGRNDEDRNIKLIGIDKLYTDINLGIIFGLILAWGAAFAGLMQEGFLNYSINTLQNIRADFWAVVLLNIVFCSLGLTLFLSLIRHLKDKTLIKHSLVYKIYSKFKNIIKTILGAGPLSIRLAVAIVAFEIIVFIFGVIVATSHGGVSFFTILLLLALTSMVIYFMVIKIKSFSEIIKGVQEIKSGNIEYAIGIEGDGDFAKLAYDINDIADGLKNAVAKEIRAEKMRSELITNVSHDLKTPLTSIINYADLLSKENLNPEVANEYVAVLKQKSEKLKSLTQDLFEISKAQSGNITVELQKIDLSVLLKQCLAEFEEQIADSGLDFKLNIQQDEATVMSDGKRLSRVFENLIGNILKYSLKSTRVYIDVFLDQNNIFIEFKNIANYEMNFKEDEIIERFVRGDKSRTTEGNGLGLAIAQSYVEACGGILKISVDGDLFKASVRFNKA